MDIRSLTSPAPAVSSAPAPVPVPSPGHVVAANGGAAPPRTDAVNTTGMHAAENAELRQRVEALMVRTFGSHTCADNG
jgi:hypothetical protein